jgi:hypothetical protein
VLYPVPVPSSSTRHPSSTPSHVSIMATTLGMVPELQGTKPVVSSQTSLGGASGGGEQAWPFLLACVLRAASR